MHFFKRFFNRNKMLIQCPRCLGKGHVDTEDIKRLGRELTWRPGSCAYCNGAGDVPADVVNKVSPGEAYLTVDLSQEERQRVLDGAPEAKARMEEFKQHTDRVIKDIVTLHYVRKLDVEEIAELYLGSSSRFNVEGHAQKKKELMVYINKVISRQN
ncbi:hypothetical protein [Chitinophaga agri]|nr:hypothetical protein [Chitinophaga agri]